MSDPTQPWPAYQQQPAQPYGQPYAQQHGQHQAAPAAPPAKKRRRVFMWVFLAVQVLFLIWAISGAASAHGTPADCSGLDAKTCNDAQAVGTGIGVAIIIAAWFFVDLFLGVGYAVYRLAKRP
jgi:hypothetical protein